MSSSNDRNVSFMGLCARAVIWPVIPGNGEQLYCRRMRCIEELMVVGRPYQTFLYHVINN